MLRRIVVKNGYSKFQYVAVFLSFVILFIANPVLADNKMDAKKHFEVGVSLLKMEDYVGAEVEFKTSVDLFPTISGLFNLANCYKALHRFGLALEVYKRLKMEFKELSHEMKNAINRDISEIQKIIGVIVIDVQQDGAVVKINGREIGKTPLSKPIIEKPGHHEIEVSLSGYKTIRETVKLISGDEKKVILTLVKTPDVNSIDDNFTTGKSNKKDKRHLPLLWTGTIGTIAAATVAGISYGLAASTKSDYDDYLEEYSANPSGQIYNDMVDSREKGQQWNKVAVGATIATGVLAVGTVIVAITNRSKNKNTVKVNAALGGLTLRF